MNTPVYVILDDANTIINNGYIDDVNDGILRTFLSAYFDSVYGDDGWCSFSMDYEEFQYGEAPLNIYIGIMLYSPTDKTLHYTETLYYRIVELDKYSYS